jgi:hypothetical protein
MGIHSYDQEEGGADKPPLEISMVSFIGYGK